jgi:anti-sigma B factor antagonist
MEGVGTDNSPQMTFDVASADGGTAIVTVRGELDIGNIERLEVAVAPLLKARPNRLVVNASGLRFADSSAIALWVGWAASVGEIELHDASPLLRRVVTSMGLERKFRLTP